MHVFLYSLINQFATCHNHNTYASCTNTAVCLNIRPTQLYNTVNYGYSTHFRLIIGHSVISKCPAELKAVRREKKNPPPPHRTQRRGGGGRNVRYGGLKFEVQSECSFYLTRKKRNTEN